MFENRTLIIATKHHKEKVIAPILERELSVTCVTNPDFDTDVFGTFSGEIERSLDPIATLRAKCLQAMQHNNYDLGVASEGSFGPHPSLFFVPADDEWMIFIDTKHQIEIVVRELSTETNFNGELIENEYELLSFAKAAGFPQHGLILRKSKDDYTDMHKGITNPDILLRVFDELITKYPNVYIETDMRAMYNPTRMAVIERTTQKLVQLIQSTCPKCDMPGFGITASTKGLPCSLCGSPTNSVLSHIYTCVHCNHSDEKMYPNAVEVEDPYRCEVCNP